MRWLSARWIGTMTVFGLLALAFVSGCSDDDPTQPIDEFAPPTNLTFINGDDEVLLDWDPSPDATVGDFEGYFVYRHTQSMVGETGTVLAGRRLFQTPTTATAITDATANNGTRYYYAVRAVKDNGDLSAPTSQIDTASRREGGPVTLHEFASTGNPSGLGLAAPVALSMQSENAGQIDVYLGTTGDSDEGTESLAFKSPHLVDSTSPQWDDRVAQLKLLDDWDTPTTSDTGWTDEINLEAGGPIVGKVIAVRTPGTTEHYAKIEILSTEGTGGNREVAVRVAYQEIAEYIRFSAPGR